MEAKCLYETSAVSKLHGVNKTQDHALQTVKYLGLRALSLNEFRTLFSRTKSTRKYVNTRKKKKQSCLSA
jgi:hypothetical protein